MRIIYLGRKEGRNILYAFKQILFALTKYYSLFFHACLFSIKYLFFKFFYDCLLLKKIVNKKYFSINKKYFSVKEKYFSVNEKFNLISRKVFSLLAVFVFRKVVMCLFAIRKGDQRKTLSSQRKIWLGFQESVFLENLGGKHFPEVLKKLEMSLFADYIKFNPQTFGCYIYFVLNIYFLISSLKF